MKASIVFESMFGNTREIAEAIAAGFATRDGEAIVRTVDEVSNDDMADQGGKRAAAFDTRFDKSKFVTGSAARRIGRVLRRHGLRLFHPEHSFSVTGMNGPLAVGEVKRARAWGAEMASTFATAR